MKHAFVLLLNDFADIVIFNMSIYEHALYLLGFSQCSTI